MCNFCGKQFSSETLLNDHNCDVHTQIKSPCNLCDKSFRSKNKVEVPHNFITCRKGSFPVWHQICWDPMHNSTPNSNLRAHKKRVHEEKPTNAKLAKHVCVATQQPKSLSWTNMVNLVGKHWTPIPLTTANCVIKRFLQRSPWTGIQGCTTTKIRVIQKAGLLFVLGAKNFVNVWNMERHQKKDHGLTEKDYVVENSAGIAIFTTQQLSLEINIFIFMI